MAINPRDRFRIEQSGITVWDLDKEFTVDTSEFLSQGKATPFDGMKLFAECVLTVCNGKTVYVKE